MTILDDKKKKKRTNYHSFIKCSLGVGTASQLRATGPVPMLPFRDETTVLGCVCVCGVISPGHIGRQNQSSGPPAQGRGLASAPLPLKPTPGVEAPETRLAHIECCLYPLE